MELGQKQQVRWVRSLLVAALTACSAGAAHVAGGGHRAPVLLLISLTVIGTPIMHAVSTRRWSFAQLVGVMAVAQLALHAAMSTLMPASMTMPHHASAADVSADGTSATMAASHIGMTWLFAALLAYGEKVLAWTIRVLVPQIQLAPFGEFPTACTVFDDIRAPRLVTLHAPRASRAPPVSFVLSH
ncbi:hypothetical protein [Dermacoccus nishinomiyaensis]|uniref:hypothetical protein n=1 Tax=Dermacoccus nishinomiyaensis TaxID=1274 RepID=UPI001EF47EB6|nr:hypothetical protein [Dermacoccus nishinomiyaensis]MCG7429169.1 hypothetical protein [Dermacoccus nishinomiyaensis]